MIYVDETLPSGDVEAQFPHRHITIKRNRDVHAQYEMLNEIGRGKFGRVMKCRHREENSDVYYAAKFVFCSKREDRRNVEREVEIMNKLSDSKLLFLYDAYDNGRNELCLVTEYIGGGELFDRVIEDEFVLTEKACAAFMRQIVEGVAYIHDQHIIHLDLKPENIMCLTKTGNRIKIIDFGLARTYEPQKKLQVLFGTPEFVAPEVVAFEPISFATDMWAVGVICYVLLSGLSPFMGDNDLETMANVTIAEYDYEDEAFNNISADAKNFIDKLLVKEKEKRNTAKQCLQHAWLNPPRFESKNDQQQIAGKQNLSQQRDNKTEEQNYVFDGHSKTMCFAEQVSKAVLDELIDEEMSEVDCRKRAGESETPSDFVIQRKRSKTPLDDRDDKSPIQTPGISRPVITLDQVKQKAGEIMENKRHSVQSMSDNGDDPLSNPEMSEASVAAPVPSGDLNNKALLSVMDQTLWQAAERTVTPLWEVATSASDVRGNVTPASPDNPLYTKSPKPTTTESKCEDSVHCGYLEEPRVTGCDIKSVSPLSSIPLQSTDISCNSTKISQPSLYVDLRPISPVMEENQVQEFVSDVHVTTKLLKTIDEGCENRYSNNSQWTQDEVQYEQLDMDEEKEDSESLLDELKDLMDCQTWTSLCSTSKSVGNKPMTPVQYNPSNGSGTLSNRVTPKPIDSPFNDLLKEVDAQIKSSTYNNETASHQQHQRLPPLNNVNSTTSLERYGNVREDILQMKNELNALKKDLSTAKRGLESDKKPLMDIMNRLDTPRMSKRETTSTTSYSSAAGGGHSSIARDVLDTQEALEDLKRTMTDFKHSLQGTVSSTNGTEIDIDNPNIRKVFKAANTGSVNQVKSRFEQKQSVNEVQQEPVSRMLNPRKKSVTPFRTATRSPSPGPVSPAPPPAPPSSLRRRSPSPVCTGNVSRVRSRFESTTPNPPKSISTSSSTGVSGSLSSNQTLPKTFKLREPVNPVLNSGTNIVTPIPHIGLSKYGGSSINLNDSRIRHTGFQPIGSTRTIHKLEPIVGSPSSPPPPRTKALLERQSSVPSGTSGTPVRYMPSRQMSHDLIQGAASFLTQALPVQGPGKGFTQQPRPKFKGPFGYSDL